MLAGIFRQHRFYKLPVDKFNLALENASSETKVKGGRYAVDSSGGRLVATLLLLHILKPVEH